MLSTSILTRESDGKLFRVVFLSHWSDILADDGEVDSVKWYGPDGGYVSANKGHTYLDITDKAVQRAAFRKDFGDEFD